LFPIFGVLAIAGALFVPSSALAQDQMVDVGGYRLFTSQAGTGQAVVVFESGLGEDTSTWQHVQPETAKFARTFVYDRAGLGKSESSPNGKSVEEMVKELHAVLGAAHVAPPYVLVGHSLGGAVVQLYAHTYPKEVAGLVLVDPEDGRLLDRLQAQLPAQEWQAREKMLGQMMSGASPAQRAEIDASKSSGKALEAVFPFPNVPVVLLSGTLKDPSFPGNPMEQDLKLELQKGFLKQVARGELVLAPKSRHYVQDDSPELVLAAIKKVAAQVQPNGLACAAPEFSQFDFWIGDWDVTGALKGVPAGTSHISKEMGGCVIWENWTSKGSGYFGKSYNTYNVNLHRWEQYWVDNGAGSMFFHGQLKDGVMDYWTDDIPQPDGKMMRRHLQFFNLSPDRVRQFSQQSFDGGKTWKVEYDLIYTRVAAPSSGTR